METNVGLVTKHTQGPGVAFVRPEDMKSESGYASLDPNRDNEDLYPRKHLQNADANETDVSRKTMEYNANKNDLLRALNNTRELLKELRDNGKVWTTRYPILDQSTPHRPGLEKSSSSHTIDSCKTSSKRPTSLKRSATTAEAESTTPLPSSDTRLVPQNIAQQYNVLRLDFKLGSSPSQELLKSLENSSVASLLEKRIGTALRQLESLHERIEDTTSKVLVTGDLNAGKSTFCNALLRRKLLPEDQQPCTNVFCEVLDARANSGVEEVHAIVHGCKYINSDESTYETFALGDLTHIAIETDRYEKLKIFVNDNRSAGESLLRNGIVDIALMDAPGLNSDSVKTTAVFARQEEIDIVVFVVSAENHFTLSAKEFIWNVANEKAYLFIVVNRFDNITNKERCKKLILEQVAALSPRTFQHASDLVHFVSANTVIPGKDKEKIAEFGRLECSLRRFVLDKRATSKLAPAKTYVVNLLSDIIALGAFNEEVARAQASTLREDLKFLKPHHESLLKRDSEAAENIHNIVEKAVLDVEEHTRRELKTILMHIDDAPIVPYGGVLSVFSYASETAQAMQGLVNSKLRECEDYARTRTLSALASIAAVGIKQSNVKAFRPEVMFSKNRKSAIFVNISHGWSDLLPTELDYKVETAGATMTIGGIAMMGSQILSNGGWLQAAFRGSSLLGLDNLKRLILPAAALATIGGIALILISVPLAIPRNLAKKLRRQLASEETIQKQASRTSYEVRKVLRIPGEQVRHEYLEALKESQEDQKQKSESMRKSADASKFFDGFLKRAKGAQRTIKCIDLDVYDGYD